jgi:hypothetical protein
MALVQKGGLSNEKLRICGLGIQEWWHLLTQIFDNGVGAPFDLETGRNGMQLDIRLDFSGDLVDLAGLVGGPHGGAELYPNKTRQLCNRRIREMQ